MINLRLASSSQIPSKQYPLQTVASDRPFLLWPHIHFSETCSHASSTQA